MAVITEEKGSFHLTAIKTSEPCAERLSLELFHYF